MGSERQNAEQTARVGARQRAGNLAAERLTDLPDDLRDARCVAPRNEKHQRTFWRSQEGGGHWVCGLCHPCPVPEDQHELFGITHLHPEQR